MEHCGEGALRCFVVGRELPTLDEVMNSDVSIAMPLVAGRAPITDQGVCFTDRSCDRRK
jgi:hypothetical protein